MKNISFWRFGITSFVWSFSPKRIVFCKFFHDRQSSYSCRFLIPINAWQKLSSATCSSFSKICTLSLLCIYQCWDVGFIIWLFPLVRRKCSRILAFLLYLMWKLVHVVQKYFRELTCEECWCKVFLGITVCYNICRFFFFSHAKLILSHRLKLFC